MVIDLLPDTCAHRRLFARGERQTRVTVDSVTAEMDHRWSSERFEDLRRGAGQFAHEAKLAASAGEGAEVIAVQLGGALESSACGVHIAKQQVRLALRGGCVIHVPAALTYNSEDVARELLRPLHLTSHTPQRC